MSIRSCSSIEPPPMSGPKYSRRVGHGESPGQTGEVLATQQLGCALDAVERRGCVAELLAGVVVPDPGSQGVLVDKHRGGRKSKPSSTVPGRSPMTIQPCPSGHSSTSIANKRFSSSAHARRLGRGTAAVVSGRRAAVESRARGGDGSVAASDSDRELAGEATGAALTEFGTRRSELERSGESAPRSPCVACLTSLRA